MPSHRWSCRPTRASTSLRPRRRSQLFTQRARAVNPIFALDADNVADVVEICRRLDGLPLAIELAAARSKLLGPRALLARLTEVLDISASSRVGPRRQRTLRDTIGWSYELLQPIQQAFFRRLGVFAGGADLQAVAAVTATAADHGDDEVLELVGELVDTSLVTVTFTPDGEPRISMLATVRAYALDQLEAEGELDLTRQRHARHYAAVAERLRPMMAGDEYAVGRHRMETEHDNFREALTWSLRADDPSAGQAADAELGIQLCLSLYGFWEASGYFSEGRRWLDAAISRGGGVDSTEQARCLSRLASNLRISGDVERAHESATAGVAMLRRLGDTSTTLARALNTLALVELDRAQFASARPLFQEALEVAEAAGDRSQLGYVLGEFAVLEAIEHNYERSLELDGQALEIARELGEPAAIMYHQHGMACTLREMGRAKEAKQLMDSIVSDALALNQPDDLMAFAEDYAAVLAELGDHRRAVRLLGAADAMRERVGAPRSPMQEAEIAEPMSKCREQLDAGDWDEAYRAGRDSTIEDALIHVRPVR